jgi:hypothetical protein
VLGQSQGDHTTDRSGSTGYRGEKLHGPAERNFQPTKFGNKVALNVGLTVFEVSVAKGIGFVLDRVWQIRCAEKSLQEQRAVIFREQFGVNLLVAAVPSLIWFDKADA